MLSHRFPNGLELYANIIAKDGDVYASKNWRRVYTTGKTTHYELVTAKEVEETIKLYTEEYNKFMGVVDAAIADAKRATGREKAEEEAFKKHRAEVKENAEKYGRPCYLRFGKPPKNGQSYNHRDRVYEDGVSVYRGYAMPDGNYVLVLSGVDWVSACFAIGERRHVCYEVTGDELNETGGDGEPLLTNVKIVSKAKITEII